MAIEKVITIKADTSQANQSIDKVDENIKQLDESTKKVSKTASKTTSVFKGLGVALKSAGIGLIIGLVAKLGETFSKNQKVVDSFSTAMGFLDRVFNDLFNFVFNNFGKWIKFIKEAFENPLDTLKDFGEAIKDNIIERFESFLNTLGLLAKGVKLLFERDFKGALDSFKEAGKESVDVLTGIDNTLDKTSETIKNVTNSISKYTTETLKASRANVELKKSAEISIAQQQLLIERYDIQAERLRQVRDEERNTIEDRIKANDELGKVLDEQEKALLNVANAQIAIAQANLNVNKNIQNQIALTEALANKEGILAQIEGFRSEQKINDLGLDRERIELQNTLLDAENERRLDQLEFEAEQTKTEEERFNKLQERLELENELLEEDIERKRELFAEGTQLRVDAEQEFLDAKQELDQQEIELTKKLEEEKTKIEKEEAEKRKNFDTAVADAKFKLAENTLDFVGSIAKKGSDLAKAIAITDVVREQAKSISDTVQATTVANAKAVAASPLTAGQPFVAINTAQAGIGIATGIAQAVKSIQTINSEGKTVQGGEGGGTQGGAGAGIQAPSFNLVEGTGTDQIAETIQEQDQPIKAFVVSSDVTTQQELDRNAVENASL